MKIAIDYTLGKHHIGGMGVYVRNIVTELQKRKRNTYVLFENRSAFASKGTFQKLFSAVNEQVRYQLTIPRILSSKNNTVSYFPNPPIPFFSSLKTVLTIPDMSFYFEDSMPFTFKWYLFVIYFLSAHRANVITTFSDYSKRDIARVLKVNPNNIHVTPLAASSFFKELPKTASSEKFIRDLGISKKYILCTPGTLLPRKNIRDLLLAYKSLSDTIRRRLQLVIVANKDNEHYPKLQKLASELKIEENVFFLGYIKLAELLLVYNHASVFVYPSLYEGFGLPPLEAMQCSVPVIVYNRTSLPEIVGGAGIIVNNPKETADAIEKIVTQPKFADALRKKGRAQANKYSWEKSAQKLEEIFDQLN